MSSPTLAEATPTRAAERGHPPLHSGDHMSRAEFERRYEAHPEINKAELIEGIVYVASPVRLAHSVDHARIIGWLYEYQKATPAIHMGDNATLRLDLDNEPQPDVMVWLDEAHGGRLRETKDGYAERSPELIVEVAVTSAAQDLHTKCRVYQRNGVQEYLVVLAYEQQVIWYALEEGDIRPLQADEQGVLRSPVFPGLWLKPELIFQIEWPALTAISQQGLQSDEHAAFLEHLQQKKP